MDVQHNDGTGNTVSWSNSVGYNLYTGGAGGTNGGTLANYNAGYYPFTATGGGCAREPRGVFGGPPGNGAQSGGIVLSDPGFLCQTPPPSRWRPSPTLARSRQR